LTFRSRTGVFGGAFDPPHRAHLLVAQEALRQCGLRRVVFVPNGIPPEKGDTDGTKEDRFRMVQILVRGRRGLSASRIEIDRKGPSYTIDTIRAMKDDCPEGLCFILGADRVLGIDTWKESQALVEMVPFIVAPRPGVSLFEFRAASRSRVTMHVLDMAPVDLSSSFVREKTARGESVEPWVTCGVARYVREHGLYRAGARPARPEGIGGSYRQ